MFLKMFVEMASAWVQLLRKMERIRIVSQLQLKRINIQDAHFFESKLTKASKDLDA